MRVVIVRLQFFDRENKTPSVIVAYGLASANYKTTGGYSKMNRRKQFNKLCVNYFHSEEGSQSVLQRLVALPIVPEFLVQAQMPRWEKYVPRGDSLCLCVGLH